MTDHVIPARVTDFLSPDGIPSAAFYGWVRQGMPIDVTSPSSAEIDEIDEIETLRTALLDAIERHMACDDDRRHYARELAVLDPSDWERVLGQARIVAPAGMSPAEHARRMALAAAAAFPEIAWRYRMTRVSRAAVAEERVGWVRIVFEQNPDVAFLDLDYLPGSADLAGIDFGPLSADERQTVVETLQSCQQIYTIAGNVVPAMEIINAARERLISSSARRKDV